MAKRLSVIFLTVASLYILKDLIPLNYTVTFNEFDILHEVKSHIHKSFSRYQAKYHETEEGGFIKGIKISIPVFCSTSNLNETIFGVSSSPLDVSVEESILYANICLNSWDKRCPLKYNYTDEFCISVSLGIGVTHYSYPLCRLLKPYTFATTQTKTTGEVNMKCNIRIRIKRYLSKKTIADNQLLTCAFFQTCAFILNERLPCGIHDFSISIPWSETMRLLKAQTCPDIKSLSDLYSGTFQEPALCYLIAFSVGRIHPVWLLPCAGSCAAHGQCFWDDAQLLRFALRDSWDSRKGEESGQPENSNLGHISGKPFTSSLSESTWIEMRSYMLNKSILFVGDSTLRGQMYGFLRKINGSLRFWEPSHGLLAFPSLRDGKYFHKPISELSQDTTPAMIAFAYFPQFWRKRDSKLNLISFIDQSIRREIEVQKVIIKSYQAGFHVPNYATHQFSLNYHTQSVREMDRKIWDLGGQMKWYRLDAYHLTWSQLNHFMADFQCSCHFHRVHFTWTAGEFEIKGEILEALQQNIVYHLLNGTQT